MVDNRNLVDILATDLVEIACWEPSVVGPKGKSQLSDIQHGHKSPFSKSFHCYSSER